MIDPNEREGDEKILDLLVDGELDGGRRREILERFDVEPGGWKRCALAFLEAQSLEGDLKELASAVTDPEGVLPQGVDSGGRRKRWAAILCMAAGLVLAFWLGRAWPVGNAGNEGEVPAAGGWNSVALRLPAGEEGKAREIEVPLVEVSRTEPVWRMLQDSILAEELFSRLAGDGHQVVEKRELIPIQLPDGRQALLPIDEIEVHPASYPVYY